MRALRQTVVALLFLGAIWGGFGALAWVLDAIPETEEMPRSSIDAGAPADGGVETDAFVETDMGTSVTAGTEVAPDPETGGGEAGVAIEAEVIEADAPSDPVRVFALETPERKPYIVSLAAGDLTGDGRPELVLGLGDRFEVFTVPTLDRLERLLAIHHRPANADTTPSSPRAVIGDATGDGVSDLLIAFWRRAHSLGSRGGGAWILRGKGEGAIDRPRRFAGPRMMICSIALLDVDGREGDEIVLGDRGRPYGDIAGRIRIYRSGRRPRPLSDFSAETNDVRMILPAHADGDERVDLVSFGEAVVRFRNTGRGRFERMEGERKGAFFADVQYGLSADLDRDGRLEAYAYPRDFETAVVIVDDDGYRSVPGTADPMRRVVPGSESPARVVVRGGAIHVGWDLAELGSNDRLTHRRRIRGAGLRIPGAIGEGHDAVVVDLDGDGSLELVSLDTAWHDGQTEWQLAIGPLAGGDGAVEGTIAGEPVTHTLR